MQYVRQSLVLKIYGQYEICIKQDCEITVFSPLTLTFISDFLNFRLRLQTLIQGLLYFFNLPDSDSDNASLLTE